MPNLRIIQFSKFNYKPVISHCSEGKDPSWYDPANKCGRKQTKEPTDIQNAPNVRIFPMCMKIPRKPKIKAQKPADNS